MCRSASRIRCRITCLAVWAAIRPKFSGVTSRVGDLVLVGGQQLRVELRLLGLAELAGLRVDRLLLLLDRLRHQLLLQLRRQDQLEDAEIGGVAVEVDAGVLGGARRLLVRGQQRVLQRRHQGLGIDPLLLLEAPDRLDDLAAHRALLQRGRAVGHEIRAADARERDLDLAGVAHQANAALIGRRQRAGEAALALDRLAGANPDPAAHEAAEVLGLGQRAVRPGRGDLQGPGLEQVAQLVRDPLAEGQVHPIRMVDVEAQRLGGGAFQRDQLDRGIELPKPGLDLLLKLFQTRPSRSVRVSLDPFRAEKKAGPCPPPTGFG